MYLIHAFDYQDDMQIRVFNYNTLERVHQFEAHSDYIRSIAVHPTQPFILSSSGESGSNSLCEWKCVFLRVGFMCTTYAGLYHPVVNCWFINTTVDSSTESRILLTLYLLEPFYSIEVNFYGLYKYTDLFLQNLID